MTTPSRSNRREGASWRGEHHGSAHSDLEASPAAHRRRGRKTPIRSNYRPTFDLGGSWMGEPALNDGRIMLLDQDELAPGAEGLVRIEPLWAEYWATVREGAVVPVQEGARVVGHVTVSLPAAGRGSRSSNLLGGVRSVRAGPAGRGISVRRPPRRVPGRSRRAGVMGVPTRRRRHLGVALLVRVPLG